MCRTKFTGERDVTLRTMASACCHSRARGCRARGIPDFLRRLQYLRLETSRFCSFLVVRSVGILTQGSRIYRVCNRERERSGILLAPRARMTNPEASRVKIFAGRILARHHFPRLASRRCRGPGLPPLRAVSVGRLGLALKILNAKPPAAI